MTKKLLIITSCILFVICLVVGLYWYTRQAAIQTTLDSITDKTWVLVEHGELGSEQPIIEGTDVSIIFEKEKYPHENNNNIARLHIHGSNHNIAYRTMAKDGLEIKVFEWSKVGPLPKSGPIFWEHKKIEKELLTFHKLIVTDSKLQLVSQDNYSLIFEAQK